MAIKRVVADFAAGENFRDCVTDQFANAFEPVACAARLEEGAGHCAFL
jgi:hypothetical protein